MQTPTFKTIIFFIIFFIISAFFISFILIFIYDQNSYLNYIENKIISFLKIEQNNNANISLEKYIIVNFDKKISSNHFKNILYYLYESSPQYIYIDINFDGLKDTLFLNEISDYLSKNNNAIGIVFLKNKKGLILFENEIDKTSSDNFINIRSKYNFLFANYLDKLKINNIFSFKSNNIGFINENLFLFDNNNIDLLYKIRNKYIFSIPFIAYSKKNNIDINKIEFNYYRGNYSNKSILYDQKGRMSFAYININKLKNIQNIHNINEFEESFVNREIVINKLKSINLFNSSSKEIQLFKEENKVIENIYNFPELNDKNQNNILLEAKNDASKWKVFNNVNQGNIKNAIVFITENNNYNWIANFFYQKNLLNYGKNIIRIPIVIIILFSIITILILLLINYLIKNKIITIFYTLFLSLMVFSAYFLIRIYLLIDFPFSILFFIILYSYFASIIINNYNNNIWIKEVRTIYKGSISSQYTKKIATFWKYKNWSLDSKQYQCTFLYIDKSNMLKKDITENEVEIIGAKNSEIESIIKKNNGIRNTFTPTEILSYFGNPPIYKEHAQIAVDTALEINNVIISINNENIKLRQALHSKEEWFKFIKKENQRYYTYFGNSINILSSMIHYAKLFNASIIISESVYKLCKLNLPVRMLDRVTIEGIKGSIRLFELLTDENYSTNKDFYNYFHAGLKLYENKKWKEAGAYFRQCLKINKEDVPSRNYLDRCKNLINNKNIENWNPILDIS